MERCQNMGHETKRECSAVGGSTSSGRGLVAIGFGCPRSCSTSGLFGVLGHTLEGGRAARGREGVAGEAESWTAASFDRKAEEEVVGDASPGSRGTRVWNRSVDVASGRGSHRTLLWGPLPSGPCVEDLAWLRVEFAEARAPGAGAGRRRDRTLAAAEVPAYKKTLVGKAVASFSLMRAGSCSNPWSAGRGLREARRPSCGSGGGTIVSRSSVFSRWPLVAGDSVCTGGCSGRTSEPRTWSASFASYGATFDGPSCSSLTGGVCTRPRSCERTWLGTDDRSESNGYQPTRRTSTRPSRSGTTPSTPNCPMPLPMTSTNWPPGWESRSYTNAANPTSYGPSSKRRNSDCEGTSFHLLCKTQ